MQTGLNQLLQHVTSLKGLAGIRRSVYDLLGCSIRDGEVKGEEWEEEWCRVCDGVVGHKLCLWEMFMRPLLLKRAEVGL